MEWKKNGYTIRMARKEEAEDYYVQNFCPLDKEVVRFTGCKDFFERRGTSTLEVKGRIKYTHLACQAVLRPVETP